MGDFGRVEMRRFTMQLLPEVARLLTQDLQSGDGAPTLFEAPHPNAGEGLFDGEVVTTLNGVRCVHRSLKTWVSLADELKCTLNVIESPSPTDASFIRLSLSPWLRSSWHITAAPSGHPEKYGSGSEYSRLHKFEEPSLWFSLKRALHFLRLKGSVRVLCLGSNRGDECEAVGWVLGEEGIGFEIVGVDHAPSAIEEAKRRFAGDSRYKMYLGDLRALDPLTLGRFDVLLSINTLQSPQLDGHSLLRSLIAQHLAPVGGVIIGLPQCRYVGTALSFGSRGHSPLTPESASVYKEIAFYRRYLYQHKFTVAVTGQYTPLICARRGSAFDSDIIE